MGPPWGGKLIGGGGKLFVENGKRYSILSFANLAVSFCNCSIIKRYSYSNKYGDRSLAEVANSFCISATG